MKSIINLTLQWKVLKWKPCIETLLNLAIQSITNWLCNGKYNNNNLTINRTKTNYGLKIAKPRNKTIKNWLWIKIL